MTRLVIPGDLILDRPIRNPYTYVKDEKTYAAVAGMLDEEHGRFMPIKGSYLPMAGDDVIGVIEDEKVIGYGVNLFSPYKGLLSSKGLRFPYEIGDILSAQVSELSEVKDIWLARPRKLDGGDIINVAPTKISRVIGKHSSMLNILKAGTKCDILVGKNGLIWIKGTNQQKAIEAINKIDHEAHLSGLTERIQEFLGISAEEVAALEAAQRPQFRSDDQAGQSEQGRGQGYSNESSNRPGNEPARYNERSPEGGNEQGSNQPLQ